MREMTKGGIFDGKEINIDDFGFDLGFPFRSHFC
jgi:hypothetical protein